MPGDHEKTEEENLQALDRIWSGKKIKGPESKSTPNSPVPQFTQFPTRSSEEKKEHGYELPEECYSLRPDLHPADLIDDIQPRKLNSATVCRAQAEIGENEEEGRRSEVRQEIHQFQQ